MSECNTEQMILIVQNARLKPTYRGDFTAYQQYILKYIKQNKFDGKKFGQTSKEDFVNDVIEYLNVAIDSTSKEAALSRLQSVIGTYDIPTIFQNKNEQFIDIWVDQPSSYQKCNVDQIVRIAESVIMNKSQLYILGKKK
eukprot:287984_1